MIWLLLAVAFGQDAEQRRLEDELVKHAQRNTWPAVEKTYERLLALETVLTTRDHVIGAQSALVRGDALLAWFRLQRTFAPDADAEAAAKDAWRDGQVLREGLETRYGLVSIYVPDDGYPVLVRAEMPFAQDERDVIEVAREKVRVERAFRGMLPIGGYQIDGHDFEVVPGFEWQVVVAGAQ